MSIPPISTSPPAPAAPPPPPARPASPEQCAPLPYETRREELDVKRNDDAAGGGITIRVPPPDAVLNGLRIVGWSIGLACLGTSAAMRLMNVRPRGISTIFVAHASFLPLPAAVLLAALCAYMVWRIARFGRRQTIITIGQDGIFVDQPTRMLPRQHVPFERVAAVERAESFPHQPRIVLRDGMPLVLPMREADAPLVLAAMQRELQRLRPPREPIPAHVGYIKTVRRPGKRFMRDEALAARMDTYDDGVRCTVTPARGWMILHIVGFAFFAWLALVIVGLVHPLQTFAFIQWTCAYAIMMIALFASETPTQRGHPKDVVLDVIGDTLILHDLDYHGRRDRWRRDEIAAIVIGGPMWWIARGGRLSLRLRDGSSLTLLHAYPLCVLRPVAEALRRALGMPTAAACASPPRARG